MYLIVTRSFPPEVGGMQSLMWGLSREMSKNFMIKVFADYYENHKNFDKQASFSIERVGGIKFLRKIRKAQLINEFLKENKVEGIIADHWKSLELIKTEKKKYCLIHGKEINHPLGSSLNKRVIKVLNNVEKVIANSEYTKNLAINNGVELNKVLVINPGTDPVQELNKTLFSSTPLFIAKFFVYSEFAITFSTLLRTFITLLFNELPNGWLISLP
jgi:phosphatidylinositol alpha-1,6-mannosyltransferase